MKCDAGHFDLDVGSCWSEAYGTSRERFRGNKEEPAQQLCVRNPVVAELNRKIRTGYKMTRGRLKKRYEQYLSTNSST